MFDSKTMLLIILLIGICYGCATSRKMNLVNLGMTKAEVVRILGSPNTVKAQGNTEYLIYKLTDYDTLELNTHFVRLVNGEVESYGATGDFDSTKIPENKTTVDLNINPDPQ